MRMLTPRGETTVRTTSSRAASRISDYNNAIRIYALTRDTSELRRFEGKMVRSGGKTYPFVTDTHVLDRLIRAGGVSFNDIYAADSEK